MAEVDDMVKDLESILDEGMVAMSQPPADSPQLRARVTRPSKSASDRTGEVPDRPSIKRVKVEQLTVLEKLKAVCVGRHCGCCAKSDRSQDHCSPQFTLLWARVMLVQIMCEISMEVLKNLKKEGAVCWYCNRVHDVIYKDKFSLSQYKELLSVGHFKDRAGQTVKVNREELVADLEKYTRWTCTNR